MNNNMVPFRSPTWIAKKAVILSRVSSKEQEDGYSIDAQNHRLDSYCERNNLKVLRIFEVTESSTRGDRKDFMAMIRFIQEQKETIALVADKVDRVQRSFKEYPLLDALIQQGKLELHFSSESIVIHQNSVGQDKTKWSLGVLMAESFILSMKENVRRSLDQKIRLGECIGLAPLGYINVKDNRGRGDVIIDTVRAHLIRKMFETYATGAFTLMEVRQKTVEWGLRNRNKKQNFLSKAQIHRIIGNPFYYGKMIIKGQSYTHRYEPIIDQALFEQCQAILNGWKRKPFQSGKRDFVFRGLIKCAVSGRTVSSELHKKTYANGNTAQWIYLRCTDPNNPEKQIWVREDEVLNQVAVVLKSLHMPVELLQEIKQQIKDLDDTEKEFIHRQLGELKTEHKSIQHKVDKLTDLLIDGAIERKDFDKRKKNLHDKLEKIEALIDKYRKGDDGFRECLLALFSIVSGSYDWFEGSTIANKRLILNFLFSNLSLKGDKLLYSLRKPFDEFKKFGRKPKWRDIIDALRTNLELRQEIISLYKNHNLAEWVKTLP